jgi:hypothetical protein
MSTHPKNVHDNEPEHKNLVKPGSTIDPSKAPAPQPPPNQQQGQRGPQQQLSEQDRETLQRRQQEAWDAAAEREKSNNPATREAREYDRNAPGMHPANQPAPDTRMSKGTRLDLEDITGNPGHRGVNPDAPAGSINRRPDDRTGRTESINEPSHINQNMPPAGARNAGAGVAGSINEPAGSQVIPAGAGQGVGGAGGGEGTEYQTPEIDALDPDEIEIGATDTVLHVHGSGFTPKSVISFGGSDMPTDFVSETEVTTGLKPSEWSEAGVADCTVKNGAYVSEAVEFEFLEAAAPGANRQSKRTKPKPQGRKHKK